MTEIITRARRWLVEAQRCAPYVGWKWVVAEKILRSIRVKEFRLKAQGLPYPVSCRVSLADIYEFTHLLGWRQVPFKLPMRPEIIVDAGANVGFSALRFEKDFPGARIIALEPEGRNIVQFKKNCGPYPNIVLEQTALWGTNARLRIRCLDVDHNAFQVKEDAFGDIEAVSVGEIMRRHRLPRIDLLKIDIEGSEKAVFSHPNAQTWLQSVGIILIELHDRFESGCTEAVQRAIKGKFDFSGLVNEYCCYVSRR
jgi:FkbM family methyltransferase